MRGVAGRNSTNELDRCQTIIWSQEQPIRNQRESAHFPPLSLESNLLYYSHTINTTNEIEIDDGNPDDDDGNGKTDVDHDDENLRSDVDRRRLCVF